MNKYFSELIDNYSLYDLHKRRSTHSHFYNGVVSVPKIEDNDAFYALPAVPNMKFSQQSNINNYSKGIYKYESQVKNNQNSNNYSTGTYYINNTSKAGTSVILVHGWRMDSVDRIDKIFLKPFMQSGFDIYHFTLPHHFDRATAESLYNGELMVSANVDRTLLSIQQAVFDLRALIIFLKEKNQKIILIGVSLGGFFTNLVATLETRIDILISVMYANSMAFSVFNSSPGKFIKKDFEEHGLTYDDVKKYWSITEPSNFKPAIQKENILLISGMYDQYVLNEDTDLLWEAWGRPKRLIYPCGHAGIVLCRGMIRRDVMGFLGEE